MTSQSNLTDLPKPKPEPRLKLCKDCIYAKRDWLTYGLGYGWRFAQCTHPALSDTVGNRIDPVSGVQGPVKSYNYFCSTNRSSLGSCAPDGLYFTSKHPT
jgi:hypothetical protein